MINPIGNTTEYQGLFQNGTAGDAMFSVRERGYVDEYSINNNKGQVFDLEVDYHEFLGSYKLVYGTFGGERIIAKVEGRDDVDKEVIKACFQAEKILFFDKETEKRIR